MPLVTVPSREDHPELEDIFEGAERTLGHVPNGVLTMAHRPELLRAWAGLGGAVLSDGTLPDDLKALVVLVSSNCPYVQAHNAERLARIGAEAEAKLAAVAEFETSERFSDAERAALNLARKAKQVPSPIGEEDFAELRKHFDEATIVELIATLAIFAFLDRWNDILASELEAAPLALAQRSLASSGW